MDTEKKILTNLLYDLKNFQILTKRSVTSEFFLHVETSKLFEIIVWYYREYNKLLQSDALQMVIQQSTKISPDLQKKLLVLFEEIKAGKPISNFALLIDEFVNYHKTNLLKQALNQSVEYLGSNQVGEALSSLKNSLLTIERKVNPVTNSSGFFGEDASKIIETYYDRKEHPEKYRGVFLGFPDFDRATGGLQKGTVTLIMGQMKSAKSILLVNMARNVMRQGKKIYYHVNEGGKSLVENRFIACDAELPYNPIRDAKMTKEEETKFVTYLKGLQNSNNLYIDSVKPASSTVTYIDSKIRELLEFGPIDLIVVDYLGLMTTEVKNIDSDWKKLGHIALELKSLAMEYQIPIIVLSHVNRKGMESKTRNFGLEDFGLSIEPLKHVDLIASWRLDDPEQFKLTHKGFGKLAIQGARDAEEPEVTLEVDTNFMKVRQPIIHVGH